MEVLRRNLRPERADHAASLENAIAAVTSSGGSTNGVLHLLAVAKEAGVDLDIDDFDRISDRTPLLCDLSPGGQVQRDRHVPGGRHRGARQAPEGARHPQRGRADRARQDRRRARRRGRTRPRASRSCGRSTTRSSRPGGLAILRGNIAPEGCVVKLAGHERRHHDGPGARVRGRGGRDGGRHARRHQARRRRDHPQRGPRRRPGHARDARGHRGDQRRRASARTSSCSPTGASAARRTASWPATSRPRRSAAARSPRSTTATPSRSTSTPSASTSTSATT